MNWIKIILLIAISNCQIIAQPAIGDTVLYLLYEEKEDFYIGQRSKISRYDVLGEEGGDTLTKEEVYEKMDMQLHFVTRYPYFDGYPLEFLSVDIKNSDTVSYDALREYPVITFDELSHFVKSNYKKISHRYYASSYFINLKSIYLIKKDDENKQAVIIKVRFSTGIE